MGNSTATAECPPERTAGIDWFRRKVTEPAAVREAQEAALAIQREDVANGEELKDWDWQGYRGKRTPRIRWGRKGRNLFWEASGGWAVSTVTAMPLSGGLTTRLDLALTLRYSTPQPEFGTQSLPPEAMIPPRRLPSGTPVGLHTGPDGMWLGTVGDRTNPEYYRLYDKGAETGNVKEGYQWRIELEAKYEAAESLGCLSKEQLLDPKWCASYVTSRWRSLGCLPHWAEDDEWLAGVRRAPRPASSSGSLLMWLHHSVRPVLARLQRVVPPEQLLEVLGLTGIAVARGSDSDPG